MTQAIRYTLLSIRDLLISFGPFVLLTALMWLVDAELLPFVSIALAGYSATIAVARQGLGAIPAAEALLITVTVTGPGNTTVTLHGYRMRYAPNALP